MSFLKELLKEMVDKDGSDLFLSTLAQPCMKAYGRLVPMRKEILHVGETKKIAHDLMNEDQIKQFEKSPDLNLAIEEPGIGRFRVNIFLQRGEFGIVARTIKASIPDHRSLGLPDSLTDLIMNKNGLILFVGKTGSGKSTSLASLIDYRNQNSEGHIITIEDPIEFVHSHKKSIVTQREVDMDTTSYPVALKNTLRQAADVIMIGEIRSEDTMEYALTFAETGHLCVSSLHANNANQALDRIMNFFPEERHHQLQMDLAFNLRGIISQRLIASIDGKRVAAIEILLNTPRVADLIKNNQIEEIKATMEQSEGMGMRTFDAALFQLYKEGKISIDEALSNADSKNNLRLRISLSESEAGSGKGPDLAGLSLLSIDNQEH
jgi:twitching motility protein PilU